jgi:hypothetical protein
MAAASTNPSAEVRLIRALRLRAQGLVPGSRGWTTAAEVAHGMLAMQAQDQAGVRWALSLRAADAPDDAAVRADLAEGRVVRNRPMRGTLQVTAPEDLHWLSATLTERSRREAAKRRGQLDLTDAHVDGAEAAIRAALRGGRVLTRPELVATCANAGVELNTMQAGHVLRHLTELMVIVFADPDAKTDTFALADEWIGTRRAPEAALGEVVTRFVTARGPVTRQDISKWAYLPMGLVDAGLEAAGTALEQVTLADTGYLVERGTVGLSAEEVDAALARPLLLPPFDEYIIGYGSRAPQLDDRFFERIVPGRNGIFKPMVVVDGEITGIWSRRLTAKRVSIELEPFTRITAKARRGLAGAAAAYGRFLGREAVLAE